MDSRKQIAESRPKPHYTLEELLAESDYSTPLTPEDREWIDAPAVGRELSIWEESGEP